MRRRRRRRPTRWRAIAAGESVIKCSSPLNMLKDTHDHRCH
jgi:hypothetical protein